VEYAVYIAVLREQVDHSKKFYIVNKKHFKNVGPIRHCEPPHAACSNSVATPGEWQCKIDVHNDNDNV